MCRPGKMAHRPSTYYTTLRTQARPPEPKQRKPATAVHICHPSTPMARWELEEGTGEWPEASGQEMRDTCLNKVEGDTQDPKSCPDLHMSAYVSSLSPPSTSLIHTLLHTHTYIHTHKILILFYKEWIVRPWAPPQGGEGTFIPFVVHSSYICWDHDSIHIIIQLYQFTSQEIEMFRGKETDPS